jgi:hypothetical protein
METNRPQTSLLFILLFVFWVIAVPSSAQDDQQFSDKVGVSLEGLGAGSRGREFIDIAKTVGGWMQLGGSNPASVDDHGWPTSDAQTMFFDVRPFSIWAPPADDPDLFQPDWSGTYKMSFQGQAVLGMLGDAATTVANQKYDPAQNLTTADLVVPKGVGFVMVSFTQTKRTADSPSGSGITMLRVIRPGYPADTKADFTNEFLKSLKPFAVLRFMDFLETNHDPGPYSDPGHHALEWKDRHLPSDATQVDYGGKYGAAWEYVAEIAKLSGKDIWINIPVAATDDYIKSLAQLLDKELPPTCNIYIEDSNEVWNGGFPQYAYNKLAAADEVAQGNSKLNNDDSKDQDVWARRRHAERLIQIGNTFRDVFGPSDSSRIRPIYASFTIFPGSYYDDVLSWVEKAYGPPKDYFYGIADAAYFGAANASPTADVEELLRDLRNGSDDNRKFREPIQRIADHYELKHCQYEGGPGSDVGKLVDVANFIRASRDPGMKDLIVHDAQDNWFGRGGDIYIYFDEVGGYSRWGCWGLSEDIDNLNTPKWQAIYQLTNTSPP